MPAKKLTGWRLSESDLDFLIDVASPEVRARTGLKKIIREDDDFCRSYIENAKVFRRVMDDDEIVLKITPVLYFEILLRGAARELARDSYTLEKTQTIELYCRLLSESQASYLVFLTRLLHKRQDGHMKFENGHLLTLLI